MDENNEAIVFMIDNSDTSINGDFEPNRLEAQKLAAQRLANFYLRQNKMTQVALGAFGSECFGIQTSLTRTTKDFMGAFSRIEPGGKALLDRAIKCSILTLKARDKKVNGKRAVVLIGSKHNMTMDSAKQLAEIANKEEVSVDIVAFGQEVDKLYVLEAFTRMTLCESYFIRIRSNENILSDSVLASPLGPGYQQLDLSDDISDDDELKAAIKASIEDNLYEEEDLEEDNSDVIHY
jgi:26S proteasome regulatory subunit N10